MRIAGFEWDDGNQDKNLKHGVADDEAEEPFYNRHKVRRVVPVISITFTV